MQEALHRHRGELRRAHADQLRGRRAFGVVVDALGIDLRRARIGRLLPETAGPGGGAGVGGAGAGGRPAVPNFEFRVAEALLHHVGDLAATSPLTVVLEDLQWADPSTLVFLHLLEGHLAEWPLLVIATHRPVERSADVEGLLGSDEDRNPLPVGHELQEAAGLPLEGFLRHSLERLAVTDHEAPTVHQGAGSTAEAFEGFEVHDE